MSKKHKNPFLGTWRIVSMEAWDVDFLDMEVPAYISIKHDNRGRFHFGAVQGEIDGCIEMLNGVPRFSFSWAGNDEMDNANGRGWVIHDGKQLIGHIYFHMGEESAFRATHE